MCFHITVHQVQLVPGLHSNRGIGALLRDREPFLAADGGLVFVRADLPQAARDENVNQALRDYRLG